MGQVNEVLEAAIQYATNYGWKLIPIDPETKRPLIQGGEKFENASSDPDKLRGWWSEHPGAGVALVCGRRSGVVVVDCDVGGDKDGITKFGELQVKFGIVPSHATMSRTPSGGMHLIFSTDEELTGGTNKLAKGIDIRAEGQYAILPPTVRGDGSGYTWATPPEAAVFVEGGRLCQVPEWIKDGIKNPLAVAGDAPHDHGIDRGQVEGWFDPGDSNHHRWLLSLSLHLRNLMNQTACMALCLRLVKQRCQETGSSFDAMEVKRAVWGAYRKPSMPIDTQYMRDHNLSFEDIGTTGDPDEEDPFALGDIGDMMLHGIEDVNYLFNPMLPLEETTVLAAEAKTGKTWIAYALALGMAANKTVLDMTPGEQGPVMICQWEMTWKETMRRLKLLCRGMDVDQGELVRNGLLMVPRAPPPLSSAPMRRRFVNMCLEREVKLVVMDSMAGAFAGAGDNVLNDNSAVRQIISETMTILAQKGVTVLGLHHLRKESNDRRARATADSMKNRILGAQQWQAAVSNLIALTRSGGNEESPSTNMKHLTMFGAGGWQPGAEFAWPLKLYDMDQADRSLSKVVIERESGHSKVLRGDTKVDSLVRKLIYVIQERDNHVDEVMKEDILGHHLMKTINQETIRRAMHRGLALKLIYSSPSRTKDSRLKAYALTKEAALMVPQIIKVVEGEAL